MIAFNLVLMPSFGFLSPAISVSDTAGFCLVLFFEYSALVQVSVSYCLASFYVP